MPARRRAGGGSLNDAYIAALLGGLRRYHEAMGCPVGEIPMGMPVSMRAGGNAMGGNRFAGARFAAPAGIADPAERIAAIREIVLAVRDEPAFDALSLLAPALSRIPAPLFTSWYASQSGGLDLQASNLRGIPVPVYIAGAEIKRTFPFGPLPGCAVMAVLVSHCGACWRNSPWMYPGTVDVAVLEPIPTSGWSEDDLNGHIANVRQRFLDTLDNWPADTSRA